MKRIYILLFLFTVTITFSHAQKNKSLVSWNFYGQVNGGTDNLLPDDLNDGLTATGITKGAGMRNDVIKFAHYWGGRGSSIDKSGPQDAIAKNKFFSLSFTPKAGKSLSLSAIKPLKIRIFSVGPTNLLLQYSLDGTLYKDITTLTIERPKIFSDLELPGCDLSAIKELQQVQAGTTVSFRLVPWGATTDNYSNLYLGSVNNGPSLVFVGSVK
ncbi:MAG: hypothetical protein EON51_01630 [Acinetobacter sp.]|nr:MAG: hypothetical protein EON51_01630 [Acinetobacter sp.]